MIVDNVVPLPRYGLCEGLLALWQVSFALLEVPAFALLGFKT